MEEEIPIPSIQQSDAHDPEYEQRDLEELVRGIRRFEDEIGRAIYTPLTPPYKRRGGEVERSKSKRKFLARSLRPRPGHSFASYRDAYSDFYIRTADLTMIGFRKHFLKKVFRWRWSSASGLVSGAGRGCHRGFYAGTFDPPTQAEMAIVRCAFRRYQCSQTNALRHRETTFAHSGCPVNQAGDEDHSGFCQRTRIDGVKALQKYGDRG